MLSVSIRNLIIFLVLVLCAVSPKSHFSQTQPKNEEFDAIPIFSSKFTKRNSNSRVAFIHSNSKASSEEKVRHSDVPIRVPQPDHIINSTKGAPSIQPVLTTQIDDSPAERTRGIAKANLTLNEAHHSVNLGTLQVNSSSGPVTQNIGGKPQSTASVRNHTTHSASNTTASSPKPHAPVPSSNGTKASSGNKTSVPPGASVANQSSSGGKNIIGGIKANTTSNASSVDKCLADEDCGLHNTCAKDGKCYHKNLLDGITTYDIIGLLAHFFFALVTVGVGSGVLFMSNLMIVLGFSFQNAAPISSILTLVAHISRNLFSFLDRHPEKDRPMINYDMSTVFAPMMLLGTIFGVICNHSFPKWLIITMFALIFSVITYKTFMKGLDLFQKEHEKNLMGYSLEVSSVNSSEEIIHSFGSINNGEAKLDANHGVSSDDTKDQNMANEDKDCLSVGPNPGKAGKKTLNKSSVDEAMSHDEEDSHVQSSRSAKGRLNTIELENVNSNLRLSLQGIQGGIISEIKYSRASNHNKRSSSDESDEESNENEVQPAPKEEENANGAADSHTMADLHNEESRRRLKSFLSKESRKVHWESLIFIFVIMMVVITFSVLRGSKKFPSPISVVSCDAIWWVLTFAFLPFAIIFTAVSIYQRNKEYDQKLECHYEFSPADFKWNRANIFKVVTSGFFTGVIGSMFGIGGSVVCSPILIQLKLHPLEANYTASFMTLFTSIASALQYMLVEQIPWDYTIALSILTFISTVLGLKFLLIWLSNNNKQSYIIFLLSFVILGSIISIMYSGINDIIIMAQKNLDVWSFKPLC